MCRTDVAIVVLGDSSETSGEGLDGVDLGLPKQLDLLKAVYETGTRLCWCCSMAGH